MAKKFVAPVEAHRVGAQKPFHAGHQVGPGCLDHQVEVIAHQTPGMDLPVGLFTGLPERFQEQLTILVGAEDRLAVVAAIHDVIDGTRILDSEFSGHVRHSRVARGCCQG